MFCKSVTVLKVSLSCNTKGISIKDNISCWTNCGLCWYKVAVKPLVVCNNGINGIARIIQSNIFQFNCIQQFFIREPTTTIIYSSCNFQCTAIHHSIFKIDLNLYLIHITSRANKTRASSVCFNVWKNPNRPVRSGRREKTKDVTGGLPASSFRLYLEYVKGVDVIRLGAMWDAWLSFWKINDSVMSFIWCNYYVVPL